MRQPDDNVPKKPDDVRADLLEVISGLRSGTRTAPKKRGRPPKGIPFHLLEFVYRHFQEGTVLRELEGLCLRKGWDVSWVKLHNLRVEWSKRAKSAPGKADSVNKTARSA